MLKESQGKTLLFFAVLIASVVIFSSLSMTLWGAKPETLPIDRELTIQDTMTLEEFGQANQLPNVVVKEVFGLTSDEELQQTLLERNVSHDALAAKVTKVLALEAEHASKNWIKIALKFALWTIYLLSVFFLLKHRKITPVMRKGLLLGAVMLFGVMLGSDPGPMGTVKDAVVLLGKARTIFPPRLIALFAMLIGGTLLANKFLCSWGCQFGTLQDVIFRLNRHPSDLRGIFPQVNVPFFLTNSIRIAFFAVMTLVAFVWATDIIEPVDPFKIFNPAVLGAVGMIFLAALLIASLFIYRPWCHFFCPFGLVAWLVEKVSIYKIHVNYETCTACNTCVKACPSTVMGAILRQNQTIPDCFSCGACIRVCPTQSISFSAGKRQTPPAGKFEQ